MSFPSYTSSVIRSHKVNRHPLISNYQSSSHTKSSVIPSYIVTSSYHTKSSIILSYEVISHPVIRSHQSSCHTKSSAIPSYVVISSYHRKSPIFLSYEVTNQPILRSHTLWVTDSKLWPFYHFLILPLVALRWRFKMFTHQKFYV